MRDMRLRSLLYSHLQVYAVTIDVYLHWREVIEQVAVIPIGVAHSIVILTQSLVQERLVIHVALLHAEQVSQIIGGIDCVTHPRHIAQVVLLTFRNIYIDIDVPVVILCNAVAKQHGITVTHLVVV